MFSNKAEEERVEQQQQQQVQKSQRRSKRLKTETENQERKDWNLALKLQRENELDEYFLSMDNELLALSTSSSFSSSDKQEKKRNKKRRKSELNNNKVVLVQEVVNTKQTKENDEKEIGCQVVDSDDEFDADTVCSSSQNDDTEQEKILVEGVKTTDNKNLNEANTNHTFASISTSISSSSSSSDANAAKKKPNSDDLTSSTSNKNKNKQKIRCRNGRIISTACYDDKWQQTFNLLLQYKSKHGHVNVPRRDGSLGNWCCTQRKHYRATVMKNPKNIMNNNNNNNIDIRKFKKTKTMETTFINDMPQWRIDNLEKVGFEWTRPKGTPVGYRKPKKEGNKK